MKLTENISSIRQEHALIHECELYGCEHGDNPCLVVLRADEDVSARQHTINGHPARLLVRTITTSAWKDAGR
jgi:hypothetical protein